MTKNPSEGYTLCKIEILVSAEKSMDVKNYLASTIHLLFVSYTACIFVRIVISWIPGWQHRHFFRFVAFLTDPFLNFFRKILPPLGGVLDLSPILAFFVLRILETFLLSLLR